jgi:hypothetical protein
MFFSLMPVRQARNYVELKAALLRRYMTEDRFKRKFRACRPEVGESFSQFSVRLASYLTRWIEMSKISETFDDLLDLILRDQLLYVCNYDLLVFLKQNVTKTAEELCMLADQFREARNASATNLCSKVIKKSNEEGKSKSPGKSPEVTKPQTQMDKPTYVPFAERKCYLCNKKSHIASQCRKSSDRGKTSSAVVSETKNTSGSTPEHCNALVISHDSVLYSQVSDRSTILSSACHTNQKPMPLSAGYVDGQPVTLLRDSGCRNIVVRKSLVKDEKLTGKFETCILADSAKRTVPLAKVYIDTPYVTGEFEVWCMENPVFDLIVGEVSNARKSHEPDPEWEPTTVLAVETRQ